jgi:TRAP-type C4-dicarboxylate transport system substrate-binding protein
MKKMIVFSMALVWLVGFMLGFSVPLAQAAEKAIELTMTYHFAPGSVEDQDLQRWARKVETDSKDRIKIKVLAGGVLAPAGETYSGISKGIADIGAGFRYGVGAPFTDELLSMAFMGTPNITVSTRVVEDLMKKYPEQYQKEWGDTKVLRMMADPASFLSTTKKLVRVPEDMQGLELRAPIRQAIELAKGVGAKPVSMPPSDYVLGVQKGTVDGGFAGGVTLRSFKLVPPIKYYLDFPFYTAPTWYMVMNLNKWNSLPADLKKVLEDASVWGKQETLNMNESEVKKAMEWYIQQGMQIITLTPQEKKKWEEYAMSRFMVVAKELDAKGYPASEALKYGQERLKFHAAQQK